MRNASFFFLFMAWMLSAQAQAFDEGGLAYTITSSTSPFTVEVTGRASDNSATDINIPDTVTNNEITYSVTSIGKDAFYFNSLASLTIGNNVTTIGKDAFGFNALNSVTIPNSVTTIGDQAFTANGLTSVTIGNSVATIGDQAFIVNGLTSVTIPDSVTTIGDYAFFDNDLTSVTFLGNFEAFELNMFDFNPGLTTITYDPLKTGWPQTFRPAGSGSVTATSGAFEQGDFAYFVTSATTVAVTGRASGNTDTVIVIPDTVASNGTTYSVTSIGDQAFYFNSLASLTIGNNVTTIGENAFGFNALNSVTIPNSVTTIGENAFNTNKLTSVTIGNSVATIGSRAFAYNILTNVIFLGDFGTFDLNMFEGNSNLTRITYVEGKTGWEDKTFAPEPCCTITPTLNVFDDGNLAYRITSSTTVEVTGRASGNTDTEIVIPDTVTNLTVIYSVTSIGKDAFRNNQLTSLTIGNNVTTIGNGAFFNNNLASLTIPNSVTTIGNNAFYSNSLASLTIGNNVATIGSRAFAYNILTSVTIPDSVTTIGGFAFFNNALTSVTIPDSVTDIGAQAFANNTTLTSVTFLGNFGTFELNMFEGNSNLTAITYVQGKTGWPKTFTPAGSGSVAATNTFEQAGFAYVITSANTVTVSGRASGNSATDIIIPDAVASDGTTYSVTAIGNNAFIDNDLTSVTIPDSVTTIGNNAFFDNDLTSVTFLGNFEAFELNMFDGNSNLTAITYVQGKTGWPQTFTPAGSGSVTTTSLPTTPQITYVEPDDQKVHIKVSVASTGGSSITRYDATCSDGTNSFSGTSSSTLITVSGLTNGVAYTCTVTATNGVGTSTASSASAAVTPEEMISSGLPIWLLYEAAQSQG